MAITSSQLQAQLGTGAQNAKVIRDFGITGSVQNWLIMGNGDYPGVTKMITTTASDNAATQQGTVDTKMKKGSRGHDAS